MSSTVWKTDPLLKAGERGLNFGGWPLQELSESRGTPLYVYHSSRICENLSRLRAALATTGRPFHIRYAMKANRFGPVLDLIRKEGDIGIDACSPNEMDLALAHGFMPDEISITASNLSNGDLQRIGKQGIHLNSDTESVIRRFAAVAKAGASFGLRLDPPVPLARDGGEKLNYVGSKFGILPGDIDRMYAAAVRSGLSVNTLHVHCGWAMQENHEAAFDAAVQLLAETARRIPEIRYINVGGGLAHRHHAGDAPLQIDRWAAVLKRHLGQLPVTIVCEIGTFIVSNAGLLLMEINTIEKRGETLWMGVNAGHAVNVYPYHYNIPLELIPVSNPSGEAEGLYCVGSNINEAQDVLSHGTRLPPLNEGDLLAMYCTGAYGAAMQSNHCLRGSAPEVLL
jgi:diaminopimelate decarboxylase